MGGCWGVGREGVHAELADVKDMWEEKKAGAPRVRRESHKTQMNR